MAQIGTHSKVENSLRTIHQMTDKSRPVNIKRIVRPMRGGSQARLVEGDDSRFYVAKFAGNTQGTRTPVNEWIAQSIMSHVGISTPPLCILRLPETLRNEELCFSIGDKKIPVEGEWHLGSPCPVNPETKVIFDFLPQKLLENVVNLNDFAKTFVVDRWLCQTDDRQAVFVRDRGLVGGQVRFRAHFIDHGLTFSGSSWDLREAALHGLYVGRAVYSLINMPEICEQTVSQIESLTEELLFSPLATLPSSWLSANEKKELNRLVGRLYKNRSKLRRVVTSQLTSLGLNRSGRQTDETCNAGSGTKRKGMGSAGRLSTSASVGYEF
jgi:hypothetical protein